MSNYINKHLYNILALGNQDRKLDYIAAFIDDKYIRYDNYGNMYVSRDFNKKMPYLVSHVDTTHENKLNKKILIDSATNQIIAERFGKQCNLGADDGCGVFTCLRLFNENDIGLMFFRDEETGCQGSAQADKDIVAMCSFAIQIDRKGASDVISNGMGTELCSQDFKDDLRPIMDDYNYKFANGSLTDVVELKQNGLLNVSCINVSCGYYGQHTDSEYIVINELNNCVAFIDAILKNIGDKEYPHEVTIYQYDYGFNYNDYSFIAGDTSVNSIKEHLQLLIDDDSITKLELLNELDILIQELY